MSDVTRIRPIPFVPARVNEPRESRDDRPKAEGDRDEEADRERDRVELESTEVTTDVTPTIDDEDDEDDEPTEGKRIDVVA